MIEAGKVRAVASDHQWGKSSNDNEYVQVTFEIREGSDEGQSIAWWGYFTEKTQERTVEALRHCGCTFPDNNITDLTGLGSKDVQLVIEHEPNQEGDMRAKVRWVNRLGGGPTVQAPMSAGEKEDFSQRLKGVLVASKPSGESNQPPPLDDSDIPF